MVKCCECKFGESSEDHKNRTDCHFNPPTVFFEYGADVIQLFPLMHNDNWCGRGERIVEKEKI